MNDSVELVFSYLVAILWCKSKVKISLLFCRSASVPVINKLHDTFHI